MSEVRVIVLRTAGVNCDYETAHAFRVCGAEVELVHINELRRKEKNLNFYHILALPGGFTYGDDIAAGKILANEIKFTLKNQIDEFIASGKLAIGICNGFQVLVKSGLLPRKNGGVTLTDNDSGKFEDRWVYLKETSNGKCCFTKGIDSIVYMPVAHAEGKFVPKDEQTLNSLVEKNLVVFRYVDENSNPCGYPYNPNGSIYNIAGICDPNGRIFGLMPHPERHIDPTQHPRWTREGLKKEGDGLQIFKNGVEFVRENLL